MRVNALCFCNGRRVVLVNVKNESCFSECMERELFC